MATAAVTYTFAPLTLIESSKGNTNFQDLVSFLNNSVQHNDGTKVYTATPSGPSADPVSDNQFTRKAYVDRGPKVVSSMGVPSGTRTTTSVSFVDWPAGEVYSLSHTKRFAATQILVYYMGSLFVDVGSGAVDTAVRVDGAGSDFGFQSLFFNQPDIHLPLHGMVLISGLAAGAHTYTLRARTPSASLVTADTGDRNSFTIMEVN